MFLSSKQRLAAGIAAAIFAIVGHAGAADRDIANVRIIAGGAEEAVEVDLNQLAVGESRQLTAASGKPAVVTRTETGLTVEVAGKRTEVHFPDASGQMTWVDGVGDGKHVKVIEIDRNAVSVDGSGDHKVVVMRRAHGDGTDAAALEVITEDLVGADGELDDEHVRKIVHKLHGAGHGDGEQVIVTRRIEKSADTQD